MINNIASNSASRTQVVYLLLLVLLSLKVGGAVSHYCFDGIEPLLTVHFDNLNGHVDHSDEAGHTDMEKQVFTENLLSKIFDLELTLAIVALVFIGLLRATTVQRCFVIGCLGPTSDRKLLPPLRAPPFSF